MSMPVPQVEKRERDASTEAIIQEALEAEERLKKARKGITAGVAKKGVDGKTLAEIEREQEKGGPVKRSAIPMAQNKRAQSRKKGGKHAAADDTEMGDEVEAFEEEAEPLPEDEGAVPIIPFNLRSDREEGYFDEEGNYVFKKEDDEDANDAWLAAEAAKVVSDEVRARVEAQQAAMQASEDAPALSELAIAQTQRKIAALMLPGETVTQALRRLGAASATSGKAMGKRERQRLAAQAASAPAAEQPTGSADVSSSSTQFAQLTEMADLLLTSGELDLYSNTKEQLERYAALMLPKEDAAPQAGGDGDDEGDMFADSDDEAGPKDTAKAAPSKPQPAEPVPAAAPSVSHNGRERQERKTVHASHAPAAGSGSQQQQAEQAEVDYSSWPIKELRRFLQERGQDTAGIVEKGDLVSRVREAAAKGPEGGTAASAPAGYAYDPSSGYWYSSESGMYWDSTTGGFCSNGKWYAYDAASGQFAEWATG